MTLWRLEIINSKVILTVYYPIGKYPIFNSISCLSIPMAFCKLLGYDNMCTCTIKFKLRRTHRQFKCSLSFLSPRLEVLNEKRTGVVQMVKLAEKERESLEVIFF